MDHALERGAWIWCQACPGLPIKRGQHDTGGSGDAGAYGHKAAIPVCNPAEVAALFCRCSRIPGDAIRRCENARVRSPNEQPFAEGEIVKHGPQICARRPGDQVCRRYHRYSIAERNHVPAVAVHQVAEKCNPRVLVSGLPCDAISGCIKDPTTVAPAARVLDAGGGPGRYATPYPLPLRRLPPDHLFAVCSDHSNKYEPLHPAYGCSGSSHSC